MAIMTDRWTDEPQVQDDLALHDLLARMAAEAPTQVEAATRQDTLQAMLTLASRAPTPVPSWRRRARRLAAVGGVKALLVAGVATAGTTGGLAATGSLPDPVQSFVHDVAGELGVGVPDAPGQLVKRGEATDASEVAPGHRKGDGPARDVAPGRQRDPDQAPGRSGEAPGHTGQVPADPQPDTSPGTDHTGNAPGQPDDAGQPDGTGRPSGTTGDDTTTDTDDAPGRSGSAPGQNRDRAVPLDDTDDAAATSRGTKGR